MVAGDDGVGDINRPGVEETAGHVRLIVGDSAAADSQRRIGVVENAAAPPEPSQVAGDGAVRDHTGFGVVDPGAIAQAVAAAVSVDGAVPDRQRAGVVNAGTAKS